ncbi:MAG: hypothetical protein ACOVOQ_01245 [Flavobacterium sp.]
MKKILLLAAFFATTLTFAANVENDNFVNNNYTVEEKTSKNSVSEDETFGCSWTTVHSFTRTRVKQVISMNQDYDVYVVETYTYSCTNCYQLGSNGSVSVTTTCN